MTHYLMPILFKYTFYIIHSLMLYDSDRPKDVPVDGNFDRIREFNFQYYSRDQLSAENVRIIIKKK